MDFTNIPLDKLLHLFYGIVAYTVLIYVTKPIIAISMVVLVSLAKEVVDYTTGNGNVEMADVVFTLLVPSLLYIREEYL